MRSFLLLCCAFFSGLLFCSCGDAEDAREKNIYIEYVSASDIPVLTVYDHISGETVSMDVETYAYHVLAAEMFGSYDEEALKAQVCAIRSFALYRQKYGGCTQHNADICTDYHSCLAFLRPEEEESRWGDMRFEYSEKLKKAVSDTFGQAVTVNGEAAFAIFHSNAGGQTEDIINVFGDEYSYLKSVESYEAPDSYKYFEEKILSFEEFDAVMTAYDKSYQPRETEILSRFDSGRVDKISIGGIVLSGVEVRSLFSLNSANFSIEEKNGNIVFLSTGYGHGVGMSQAGAQQMALDGCVFKEILSHYYPGTSVEKIY